MTLVEALVVLIILSFSMLVTAKMLAEASNLLVESVRRQQAVRLGSDLAELWYGMSAHTGDSIPTAEVFHCGRLVVCEPEQLLAHELFLWQEKVGRALPNGQGKYHITQQAGRPVLLIRISWLQRGGQPTALDLQTRLVAEG